MFDFDAYWWFIIIPVIIILGILFDRMVQSPNDYNKSIIKSLQEYDCELISVRIPKIFDTGPFPSISIQLQPISTNIGGVKGEKTRYRIVTYKTPSGEIRESWVKIDIVAFQVFDMEWSPSIIG